MKVMCPNCRKQVRITLDGILVQHVTPFNAPCRLSEEEHPDWEDNWENEGGWVPKNDTPKRKRNR